MVVYIEKGADLFEKILSNYNLFLLISHTQKLRSESFWFTGKNSVYTRTLFFLLLYQGCLLLLILDFILLLRFYI